MGTEKTGPHGKTKVAAWWLIVVGAATTILGIALIPMNPASGYIDGPISAPVAYVIFSLALTLPGILNIIAGIMLLKRKPRAPKLALTLLSIESIFLLIAAIATAITESPTIVSPFIIAPMLYLTPMLLLLLDRDKI